MTWWEKLTLWAVGELVCGLRLVCELLCGFLICFILVDWLWQFVKGHG